MNPSNGKSFGHLPPGLKAFISDANRANNKYSLKALIQNENYSNSNYYSDNNSNSSQSIISDAEYYQQLQSIEMEQLTQQLKQLNKQKLELEQLLIAEYEKQSNDIIIEIKNIIQNNNKINQIEILKFMITQNISWNCFNNNSPKKQFVNLLRKHSNNNIKYGIACKIWNKMNIIYNEKIICYNPQIIPYQKITEIPITIPSRDRSLIFISEECTQNAINNKLISEYFETSKQLFHFLRWTIKMQQIDGFYKIFSISNTKNKNNKSELVIFNIELHSSLTTKILYIVGIENDKTTVKSPRWKMIEFMTGNEIYKIYGIKEEFLPVGSRIKSEAFEYSLIQKKKRFYILCGFIRRYFLNISMVNINIIVSQCYCYYSPFTRKYKYLCINNISCDIYCKLPQIKTQQKKELHKIKPNELQLTSHMFYKYIQLGINNNNGTNINQFIEIVSFDKHKTKYFIDLLLPIKLINNNWIGIIYRNNLPISICIDCNDIKTKSKLYDPNNNINQYKWMNNNITRLTIINISNKNNNKINQNNQNNKHTNNNINSLPQQRHKLVLKEIMYR